MLLVDLLFKGTTLDNQSIPVFFLYKITFSLENSLILFSFLFISILFFLLYLFSLLYLWFLIGLYLPYAQLSIGQREGHFKMKKSSNVLCSMFKSSTPHSRWTNLKYGRFLKIEERTSQPFTRSYQTYLVTDRQNKKNISYWYTLNAGLFLRKQFVKKSPSLLSLG